MPVSSQVAVVGAGVAGMVAARTLRQLGHSTTVIDMGTRGPGGRTSTRRAEGYEFDHGCQFFRAESPEFQKLVSDWVDEGAVCEWQGRLGAYNAKTSLFTSKEDPSSASKGLGFCEMLQPGPIYVGSPGMDAVAKSMVSDDMNLVWGTKVKSMRKTEGGQWMLDGLQGMSRDKGIAGDPVELGPFDVVLTADIMVGKKGTPGEMNLTEAGFDSIRESMENVVANPTFALMLAFDAPLANVPFDGATVLGSDGIAWLSRNSSKPGRPGEGAECWVALTTVEYARSLIADTPLTIDGKYNPQTREYLATIAPKIWEQVKEVLSGSDADLPEPSYMKAQRWGAAFQSNPATGFDGAAVDADAGYVACGDWVCGSRIENVALSAMKAATAASKMLV